MIALHCLAALALSLQQAPGPAPADAVDEVLGNVRAQPLGPATVGDLALPEPFLRRYADRILRSAYEEQFRVVVDDSALPPAKDVVSPKSASTAGPALPASAPPAASKSPTSTLSLVVGAVCGLALVVWLVRRRRTA